MQTAPAAAAAAAAAPGARAAAAPARAADDGGDDDGDEDAHMAVPLYVSLETMDAELARCEAAIAALGECEEATDLSVRVIELGEAKRVLIERVEAGELQPAAYLALVANAVRADGARARALLAAGRKDAAQAVAARVAVMEKELADAAAGNLTGE
jgi:hypothetical protein